MLRGVHDRQRFRGCTQCADALGARCGALRYIPAMDDAVLRPLLNAVQSGNLSIDRALTQLQTLQSAGTPLYASSSHTDEFERVRELAQLFNQPALEAQAVQLGIGDDAAVLRQSAHPWVFSVDVAVQGVHFDPRFASWDVLGARAFNAALSDLAAMGATPVAALSASIVPASLSAADFSALHAGIARAAAEHACPVVGGNLSSGRELSVTTTVIGHLRGHGMFRSAARAGDAIYVTGTLGSAALGLRLLQRNQPELGPRFVEAWRAPQARIREGLLLVDYAHAAIDVSDGAYQDLGHICAASALSAELEATRIPLAPGFAALAEELGEQPLALALLGGEDYELIYTLPEDAAPGPGTCIGRMLPATAGPQVRVLDQHAQPVMLEGRAFRHF